MDRSESDAVGVLNHYGVLGMRWGFRKGDSAPKILAKNGAAWVAANLAIIGGTVATVASAVPAGGVAGTVALPAYAAAVAAGAPIAIAIATGAAGAVTIKQLRARHSEEDGASLSHSEESESVLKHYGVLGMRWGFRKSDYSQPGPASKVSMFKNNKTGLREVRKTRGGSGRDVSEDATKAAVNRQIAKSSGPEALDNKDLQALITRMNLEQQYAKLTYKPSRYDRGQKYAKTFLGLGKTVNDLHAFSKTPSGQALRLALAPETSVIGKHRKS